MARPPSESRQNLHRDRRFFPLHQFAWCTISLFDRALSPLAAAADTVDQEAGFLPRKVFLERSLHATALLVPWRHLRTNAGRLASAGRIESPLRTVSPLSHARSRRLRAGVLRAQ